ncbi:nitrous oxide reductase accessory protein NosL [Sulfurospirillum deleyianum]|uniref:NosL family protein n=1 Tax=Sulfurospirillum deleyianum (strain ATCC 51133 / DSM 6946 / 5175) TaxID=525898 RepID=D1B0B5_SULD5|nr:nitrous oxide reductase accessory protein NosL [Sulfurospirillum deleyianum]ACZ11732.1 NosL family protein [Sulfurospirillum deleyianum DSM 6946]
MFQKIIMLFALCLNLSFAQEMFQSVPEEKAVLIQSGDAKRYCPNCGMDLVKFQKTSHAHKDHQYCSIHCLVEDTKGVFPKDAKVIDTKNLGFIEAINAFYVVGSSKPGTMTMNSQYAFVREADAKTFQEENGGRIVKFEEAYAIAKEDFAKDSAMLKNKRERSVYGMGEKLYNNGCEKVNAASFANIALLKVALKKACRLESEGQYQMVALYLWDHKAGTTPSVAEEKIIVPSDAKCPVCGMFVAKYPQWVAVIETPEKPLYFDGVKDMMKYIFAQKKHFEHIYVSDYYSLKKLNATKAFYVIGANVYGPMGAELIPFASESEAVSFMKDHSGKRLLRFDDISEKTLKSL